MKWAGGVLICLAVLAALYAVLLGGPASGNADRVYTPAEVWTGLHQHPQSWIGRTVRVSGATALQMSWGVSSACPACARPDWIYLRAANAGRWNRMQRMEMLNVLTMLAVVRPHVAAASWLATIPGTEDALSLQLSPNDPSGASLIPQPHRVLPDALYASPLLGPVLAHLFPLDNRLIVRVRLSNPNACATPGVCPDGFVLDP